jgi:hypothetical protein
MGMKERAKPPTFSLESESRRNIMPASYQDGLIAADVKCYYCGHVSGQMVARRGGPFRLSDFVPRPGFAGEMPASGKRLRCERCKGPVFLEDAPPPSQATALRRSLVRDRAA